jgi:hypothetical protein
MLCACSAAPSSTAVWTANSETVDVTCGTFFIGSTRFHADRSQLSDAQLGLLAGLTTTAPTSKCPEDTMSCSISVTHADGTVAHFRSSEDDPSCGSTTPLIPFTAFEPFIQTLGCRYSKAAFLAPDASAAPVIADARCYDGLFVGAGGGTVTVSLQVDVPGTRHVELDECNGPNQAGKLSATLDTSPPTPLDAVAPTGAGPDGVCATSDVSFAQPGVYTLTITVASDFLPAGDFWLRFY